MALVTFRFLKPNSIIGQLITWRLGEPWSHVVIMFDDIAYSAQIPVVVKRPSTFKTVATPPREGLDVVVEVSDTERARMIEWCEGKLGKMYDLVSILGWFFGWKWLQLRRNTYCFEFVRECLEHMGWLEPDEGLIKGNRLIEDIEWMIMYAIKPTEREVELQVA